MVSYCRLGSTETFTSNVEFRPIYNPTIQQNHNQSVFLTILCYVMCCVVVVVVVVVVIIIIIIIIGKDTISFMHGIYTYIPETNHVPKEYNVLLLLLLLVKIQSPLCRVFTHIFLRQTMSLRNTMLQLFCRYCLWCPYH
jgi:hypothetical protein